MLLFTRSLPALRAAAPQHAAPVPCIPANALRSSLRLFCGFSEFCSANACWEHVPSRQHLGRGQHGTIRFFCHAQTVFTLDLCAGMCEGYRHVRRECQPISALQGMALARSGPLQAPHPPFPPVHLYTQAASPAVHHLQHTAAHVPGWLLMCRCTCSPLP